MRTGLRHVYADSGEKQDPSQLSETQLLERVKDHTGQCSHARDRLARLHEAAVELQLWRKNTQQVEPSAGVLFFLPAVHRHLIANPLRAQAIARQEPSRRRRRQSRRAVIFRG